MRVALITQCKPNTIENQVRAWAVCHVMGKYGFNTEVWNLKEEESSSSFFQRIRKKFLNNDEKQVVTQSFFESYHVPMKIYKTFEELKQTDGVADSYLSIGISDYESQRTEIKELTFITTDQKYKIERDPLFWLQEKDFEGFHITPEKNAGVVFDLQNLSKDREKQIQEFRRRLNEQWSVIGDYDGSGEQFQKHMERYLGAKKIVTNTAYGTMIALVFHIPFVYLSNGEGDPVVTILEELQFEKHIVKETEIKEESFAWEIEGSVMDTRLRRWRRVPLYDIEEGFHITCNEERVLCPTNILRKECYGCYACEKVCPTKAITMVEDKDGFPYPVTNEETCINCGACERACIRLKETNCMEEGFPRVRAANNKDLELREQVSSSGGVFPELCREIIEKRNGVVVGVAYDENMRVMSQIAETMEEAKKFCNSKYVKSQFAHNFPKVKELLQQGRYVLYTGVPCECASLRSYLKKDYDNLLVQEIMCHAGPSPKVFAQYIQSVEEAYGGKVVDFIFRDKREGWRWSKCKMAIIFEDGREFRDYTRLDDYFKAFFNDYLARPSCANCQFVGSHRCGDLTLGDFWGVQNVFPELYDNKGTSLVIINTEKGWNYWESIKDKFDVEKSRMREAFRYNHSKPSPYKEERVQFFHRIEGKTAKEVRDILFEYNNAPKKKKRH